MSTLAFDLDRPNRSITRVDPSTIIQMYVEAATELLARDSLEFRMEFDLADWCRIISSAPRTDGRNPAFVPGATRRPPDDAYWLRVTHFDGRLAGIMAARYIETEMGFYDYVRDGQLWWPDRRPLPVIPTAPGPTGRMAHTGGLWVSPDRDFAGIGLSWLLTRLNHAIALARWDLDWVIGVVFKRLLDKGVAANYGAETTELMLDAPFGTDGARLVMYALPNSRQFVFQRTWNDLLQIRNEENKKMRDFAPYAKRKNQTPEDRGRTVDVQVDLRQVGLSGRLDT